MRIPTSKLCYITKGLPSLVGGFSESPEPVEHSLRISWYVITNLLTSVDSVLIGMCRNRRSSWACLGTTSWMSVSILSHMELTVSGEAVRSSWNMWRGRISLISVSTEDGPKTMRILVLFSSICYLGMMRRGTLVRTFLIPDLSLAIDALPASVTVFVLDRASNHCITMYRLINTTWRYPNILW